METQQTEYKQTWRDEFLKEICAFANAQGGMPRNTKIAATFYRAGFIESWGRGIEKIRSAVQADGMDSPVFSTEMGGVSVRFFRAGLPQSSEDNDSGKKPLQAHNLTTLQPGNLTTLMQQIVEFCAEWHTMSEIAEHVNRSRQYIRGEVLPKMSDVLERKFDSPNHPNQQYRKNNKHNG